MSKLISMTMAADGSCSLDYALMQILNNYAAYEEHMKEYNDGHFYTNLYTMSVDRYPQHITETPHIIFGITFNNNKIYKIEDHVKFKSKNVHYRSFISGGGDFTLYKCGIESIFPVEFVAEEPEEGILYIANPANSKLIIEDILFKLEFLLGFTPTTETIDIVFDTTIGGYYIIRKNPLDNAN